MYLTLLIMAHTCSSGVGSKLKKGGGLVRNLDRQKQTPKTKKNIIMVYV